MKSIFGYALGWAIALVATVHAIPWQARHRMTSSDYQDAFGLLVSQNYSLTYVSGYTINNDPRFAAIWEQKSGGTVWVARHGMTGTEYQEQFDAFVAQGFRPILVNGYTVNGQPQYAAIWDKSAGTAWVAKHGLTSSQYQDAFTMYASQGYRLKHVSGYSQGNDALYAAIWDKSGTDVAWVANHGMTSSDYQSLFDQYVKQGFRPVHVSGYVVNNVDYYAAIWDKSPSGAWVARHGMSADQYQNEFNTWGGQGYRLTLVSGYTLGSDHDTYAALWLKE